MKKLGQDLTQSRTSVFLFTFFLCTIINIFLQKTLTVSDLIGIFVETTVIAFGIWQVRKMKRYVR
ncbi:positive regulator of sigma E activity [Enterococcus ureilyticus]|nr:positive regulator of sigma E activity [Enterococcus ureilyticus]